MVGAKYLALSLVLRVRDCLGAVRETPLIPLLPVQALYASFDRFPSSKGAAVHINRFAPALFDRVERGLLCVLGDATLPSYQREGSIQIARFDEPISNFLERTIAYGAWLAQILEHAAPALSLCHFRDPWSGVAVVGRRGRSYRSVYEVNGLPSIELRPRFPDVDTQTWRKIEKLEQVCLEASTEIITVSEAQARLLVDRGISREKITVIPNGATCHAPQPRPSEAPSRYIVYVGALQRWQGVEVLLRAFRLLRDLSDVKLVLCCSTRPRLAKGYHKLAEKLDISARVVWHYQLPREQLVAWLQHAELSVAPLTECERNTVQGCCPLKILESMAAGVPVVASDLPAVRELVTDRENGWLVRAERPEALARALRVLLESAPERARLGTRAQETVLARFTWEQALRRLDAVYDRLLGSAVAMSHG